MISATAALASSYDYNEVARSVVIAVAASYAALDLAGRVTAAKSGIRLVWLSGGAIAMGIGIWAMHLKGMLAIHLPVPVEYRWPTVLASLLVAVLASAVALYVSSRHKMGSVEALTGSIFMGAGIAGMHYIGMAAMRLPAITRYSPLLVTCSILLAILFSLIALLMAFGLREETRWSVPRRLGSATVMGVAVSAMHYTGMAAANFIPGPPPDLAYAVSVSPIGNSGVVIVTLILLLAAILTSSVDRRARAEIQGLNQVIVEAASDAVISMDESGGILLANPATARVFGYDPAELIGKPLTVLMPEFMRKLHEAGFRRYLATGQRHLNWQGTEVTALHKNGQEFPVEVSFGEMTNNGHKAFVGFVRDISEKKRAEDELRRQKEVFQKIFENIPVIVCFVRADNQIELVNPEWERTMGWTLAEIHERNLDIFAKAYPDPQYRQMVLDFVAASTGEWTDLKVRVRDGRVIDLAVAVVHVSDGTSVAIGRDVTERKRTEEALQEAQDNLARVTRVVAMGELAAAIAHEVNQPLAAIVTNASFCIRHLESASPKSEQLREAISEIVNDGTRASTVISRIRALLQKSPPERIAVDMNQIIQEVATLLRGELTRNGVSLRTDLGADLPRVLGDRVLLQQVLINLVMNSIDAMRSITLRPRELLIRSAKNHNEVSIQVQDSGTGLDRQRAEHIFEPFFTTKPEGIGMGLSIARSIVESHGGRLSAESRPEGALFQFTLPPQ